MDNNCETVILKQPYSRVGVLTSRMCLNKREIGHFMLSNNLFTKVNS